MQYKKEDVRKKILKAATTSFSKNGYMQANMLQISRLSKETIGNLYRYYPSKAALFEAIVEPVKIYCFEVVENLHKATLTKTETNSVTIVDMASNIAEALEEMFSKYVVELSILLEKSQGSKYEGFRAELIANIIQQIRNTFSDFAVMNDTLIPTIIVKGLLEGFIHIFKKAPKDKRKEQVSQLIVFYFHKLEERII